MDLRFKHIDEKDIDLLIMDRFTRSEPLMQLFISKLKDEIPGNSTGFSLIGAQHSVSTNLGESDLILLLSDGECVHAILVEDKIDAPPQYRQAKRYQMCGEDGVASGDWSSYSIVLVAPQRYLDANTESYPHTISYQRLRDALGRDDEFGWRLLSEAIEKQREGWQLNRDEVMSAFYDEVAKTAQKMKIQAECKHKIGKSRASKTAWIYFDSPLSNTTIAWKSEQGIVALCIPNWGGKENMLKERIGEIPEGWYWRPWKGGVNTAYLCVDALYKVTDWAEATKDIPLIVDALYKVQSVYLYARKLNNQIIDWESQD